MERLIYFMTEDYWLKLLQCVCVHCSSIDHSYFSYLKFYTMLALRIKK